MLCNACNREVEKAVKCRLCGIVCFKCCFAISTGSPDLLRRLKDEKNLAKDEILRQCNECSS